MKKQILTGLASLFLVCATASCNNERPMYCLGYKTPRQYRTDMGY